MSFRRYQAYKESGVQWLGQIPSHWETIQSRRMFRARREAAKKDDIMLTASQKYGMIPQADFVEKEGRRVVEVIQGKDNLIHVEPNDFVISMRSFQGGLEWCRFTGSTSFHYVPVTPLKHVTPAYFAYLFKSHPYISALRSTTNLIRDGQEIRYSNFVQVPLPVVPDEEQLAIASFLDRETAKIDALIAEQQRLIELLQEKRQAVISHAVTKGLNPNAPMKDSGVEWLGEVPEHWGVKQLNKLLTKITNGYVGPTREILRDEGVRYLQSLHIKNNQIAFDSPYYVSEEWSHSKSKSILQEGDVLVVQTGDIGQSAVVTNEFAGCNCHALIIISPVVDTLSGDWLSWYPFRGRDSSPRTSALLNP